MNLLEMYKQLSNDEKQEFIELLLEEINKKTTNESRPNIEYSNKDLTIHGHLSTNTLKELANEVEKYLTKEKLTEQGLANEIGKYVNKKETNF